MNGTLGWLVQPLSMVITVTTTVSPQWRSVREQLVPLDEQLWMCLSVREGAVVAK